MDVIRFPHVLVWHMHLVAGLMYVASHKCQTEGERINCPGGGSDTSGFPGVWKIVQPWKLTLWFWRQGLMHNSGRYQINRTNPPVMIPVVQSVHCNVWVMFSVLLVSWSSKNPRQFWVKGQKINSLVDVPNCFTGAGEWSPKVCDYAKPIVRVIMFWSQCLGTFWHLSDAIAIGRKKCLSKSRWF